MEAHGGEEKGNVDLLLGSEHTSVGLGVDQENMVANPASEAVWFFRKYNYLNNPSAITTLFMGDAYWRWTITVCGLSIALGQRTTSTIATIFLSFVLNLAFTLSVLGFLIIHISLVAMPLFDWGELSEVEEKLEQFQILENSTMAEKLYKSEGWNERNEHAMENLEEVASMVDMSIHKSTD